MQSYTSTAAPPPRRARQPRHLREAQGVPGFIREAVSSLFGRPSTRHPIKRQGSKSSRDENLRSEGKGSGGAEPTPFDGWDPRSFPQRSRCFQGRLRCRHLGALGDSAHTLSLQVPDEEGGRSSNGTGGCCYFPAAAAAAVAAVERLGRSRSQPMLQFRALLTG
ncbi:hypothetical protein L1887_56629 [Cichorium endivia]|nr:hypothetical protein L1887_56629 [Cichorium endivia]